MSRPVPPARRPSLAVRLLATAALASWPLPFWCVALRIGAAALADTVLPLLLALGALSLTLRLLLHRRRGDFGIFFPDTRDQRGTVGSIRVNAALLLIFNLGAAWFVLHNPLSRTTTIVMLVLTTVSAMNLADESWMARGRRLASRS